MLRPEIKKQWVEDLRTPGLKQAHGHLHVIEASGTECYCVLGRLIVLAVHAGVSMEVVQSGFLRDDDPHKVVYYNDEDLGLPTAVKRWAGMQPGEEVKVLYEGRRVHVTWLNDGENEYPQLSLPEIAALIEADPEL